MLSEDLENVGKQGNAGTKQNEAHDVQRMGPFSIIGKVKIDQNQAEEADGDIEEENHPPVQIPDDQSAGDGPKHRGDKGGDGDKAHGAEKVGFGEGADQGEPPDGNHHGSAA